MEVTKSSRWRCFCLQTAASLLLPVQLFAQTGSAKPVAEIDLKPLGVNIPSNGHVSAKSMELLLVSDTYLVLAEENSSLGALMHPRLILYEIGPGGVRSQKTLGLGGASFPIAATGPTSEESLEWVDAEHFAYRISESMRWLCDTKLNCRDEERKVTPADPSLAESCQDNSLLGRINPQRVVCRTSQKYAMVMDSGGHHLYSVDQARLPWDTRLVTSAQGQRFGLGWRYNTWVQLLNPLACIDECPPAGRQQFSIFNASDGTRLQDFIWDPRPYNLYVTPALSPSGKTAAFVRVDKLAIYSLN